MKKFKENSKTKECLMKAFIGEGGARNRYTYYAKAAKKEGYEQISAIFSETAENEKEHAKRFIKFLGEEYIDINIMDAKYPAGLSDKTELNLLYGANGEHEENTLLYPSFAKIAQDEGYDEIADNFFEIAEVEVVHEKRFLDLLDNIKNDRVFKRDTEVIWKCRNCGYHHKGKEAPLICPSCKHPRAYFEIYVKNY